VVNRLVWGKRPTSFSNHTRQTHPGRNPVRNGKRATHLSPKGETAPKGHLKRKRRKLLSSRKRESVGFQRGENLYLCGGQEEKGGWGQEYKCTWVYQRRGKAESNHRRKPHLFFKKKGKHNFAGRKEESFLFIPQGPAPLTRVLGRALSTQKRKRIKGAKRPVIPP